LLAASCVLGLRTSRHLPSWCGTRPTGLVKLGVFFLVEATFTPISGCFTVKCMGGAHTLCAAASRPLELPSMWQAVAMPCRQVTDWHCGVTRCHPVHGSVEVALHSCQQCSVRGRTAEGTGPTYCKPWPGCEPCLHKFIKQVVQGPFVLGGF
jgi:hypothetical protein